MATRWRCPPESWVGRAWGRPSSPTSAEGVEGLGPPFGLGDPGVEEAVGHVVEHALVLGQEELLEHEADPGGPQRGQLPVGEPLDVEAGDAHVAGGGPVQGAHQVQQGGLARPRRADDAHQLALGDGEADASQGGHRRLARVDLGHLVDLEHRPWPPPSSARGGCRRSRDGRCGGVDGHRFGTTTRWPAASPDPVTWTSPSASSKRPKVTGTRWWMPSAPTTSTA